MVVVPYEELSLWKGRNKVCSGTKNQEKIAAFCISYLSLPHLFAFHSMYPGSVVTDANGALDTKNARSIAGMLPNWEEGEGATICFVCISSLILIERLI